MGASYFKGLFKREKLNPYSSVDEMKKKQSDKSHMNDIERELKKNAEKLKQEDEMMRKNNVKNEEKEEKKDESNKIENIGKKNLMKGQGVCENCQVKIMTKFMDYTHEIEKCKCRGYGVVSLRKLSKRCGWLCLGKSEEWDICHECLGVGFVKKRQGWSLKQLFFKGG